jgi:hypothetical protein
MPERIPTLDELTFGSEALGKSSIHPDEVSQTLRLYSSVSNCYFSHSYLQNSAKMRPFSGPPIAFIGFLDAWHLVC